MKERKKERTISLSQLNKNLLFIFIFFSIAVFSFWRCKYGFAQSDESLFLTIPHRMSMGDVFFAHEWHISQMSTMIFYPVINLFLNFNGSTEGIVIFVRYLYVTIQLISGAFIFYRLNRLNYTAALSCTVIFILFTSNSMYTFYYMTLGVIFMTVTSVIIITSNKYKKFDYFVSGILFACAVLCCPYLVILFAVYVGSIVVSLIFRKKFSATFDFLSPILFIFFIAGICVPFTIFMVYLLFVVSPSRFLECLPLILNDGDHSMSVLFQIIVYFGGMIKYNNLVACVIMFLLLAELVFRRKYKTSTYFISVMLLTAVMIIHLIITSPLQTNYLMFPLTCAGIFCWFLSSNPTVRYIFYTAYIPGVIYSFCLNLGSNQGFVSVSSACCVSSIAAVIMLSLIANELYYENNNTQKAAIKCIISFALLILLQICVQGYSKYNVIYPLDTISNNRTSLDYGIMKNCLVTTKQAELYDHCYNTLDIVLQNYPTEKILWASERCWMYLMSELEYASYSSWTYGTGNEAINKLSSYYELYPQKLPDTVVVDSERPEFIEWFMSNYSGYIKYDYDFGCVLAKS